MRSNDYCNTYQISEKLSGTHFILNDSEWREVVSNLVRAFAKTYDGMIKELFQNENLDFLSLIFEYNRPMFKMSANACAQMISLINNTPVNELFESWFWDAFKCTLRSVVNNKTALLIIKNPENTELAM